MSKRLLLLASLLLLLIVPQGKVLAQTDPNLFKLPDTVCTGHEIAPFDIIEGAANYNWTFCPPNLGGLPNGNNMGAQQSMNATNGIVLAEDEGVTYSFHINTNGGVVRMRFLNGYEGAPSQVTQIGSTLNNPRGIYAAQDGGKWNLFIVAGTDSANSRLMHYTFTNGLKAMPTEVNLGNMGGALNGPKHLFLAKDQNGWYGFSFTKSDEMLRLSFGNALSNVPTVSNMGNIDGHFSGVSGITGIVELNNWHLFITNRTASTVNHITFGNALSNTPYVDNLGDLASRVVAPVGIAITRDCDAYYGYVLNYGTSSIITLKWDAQSIANPPAVTNHGNTSGFTQARALSGIARDSGSVYMLSVNGDNSISRVFFNPCTDASIPSSGQRLPPTFKLMEPGVYTIFLTINEGLPNVTTDCEQIVVYDHPPITLTNDLLLCQGDTTRLSVLSFSADSFKWSPNYNIDTLYGQFVNVHPTITTTYYVTAYYDVNCIVKNPIEVKVSKIVADAGPDRIISDGSRTVLGGPGTTLGTQYTYEWFPEIGFTRPTNLPVSEAQPPYDITYYLRVRNTDGCSDIDTVQVTVPCDDIHLPNAFTPGSGNESTNRFGIWNLQLVKINYFKIFDRWGKEVFTTTDKAGRWDGKVDGKDAPLGVYVWEIDANCANTQQRFRKSGTVTLLR
ncbi:gliding motility-associated C-terminal domain-containing protein [Taibaiella chishuiensis]|uniref:Gliding motility-associated-like protein n=1 Tax=Taibaiella chishuiensis TaxID=1434707 RepID=A0A2P8DDL6_9BACT|nr:gliding motility-associated C-terminal domain-containing protein [Taibaiella chishuiensis]PSK95289.1 gliding motility-associated-like protein [Taibaiella chishuiensis]